MKTSRSVLFRFRSDAGNGSVSPETLSHFRWGSAAVVVIGLMGGCHTPTINDPWVKEHGPKLDRVQRWVEEYGTISMGTPILSLPDERFSFELNRTAEDYFKDAKNQVQGGAASFQQELKSLGISLSAQFDPTQVSAYADEVQQVLTNRRTTQRRNLLLNQAARMEYAAALQIAATEEDPQVRAKQEAAALRTYAESLQAAPEVSRLPTAPTDGTDVPSAATVPRDGLATTETLFSNPQFTEAGGLLNGTEPVVSSRAAVAIAAGDKAMAGLFSVLSKPDPDLVFSNTQTVFGVTMVSVNPGWRTSEGFLADISMSVELKFEPARMEVVKAFAAQVEVPQNLRKAVVEAMGYASTPWANSLTGSSVDAFKNAKRVSSYGRIRLVDADEIWQDKTSSQNLLAFVKKGGFAPRAPLGSVTAISPMTDGQVLDLAGSNRSRTEFALSLAAAFRSAGQGAQAGLFQNFAKQLENDAVTRSNQVSVNAYSNGGTFGFKISPAFEALVNPRGGRPRSGYRLRPNSFPALINMSIPREHLDMALLISRETDSGILLEPRLRFVQMPRWQPWDSSGRRNRLSLTEKLEGASILRGITKELHESPFQEVGARQVAHFMVSELQQAFSGAFVTQALPVDILFPSKPAPKPQAPNVTRVEPSAIQLKIDGAGNPVPQTVRLILIGDHLDEVDLPKIKSISGGATVLSTPAPLLEGGTVVLSVKVDKADTSLVLSLPSSKGAPAGLAVVPVSLVVPSPKPAPAKDALVSYKVGELERQVTISAGASAESAAAAAEIISTDLKPKTEQGSKQDPKK